MLNLNGAEYEKLLASKARRTERAQMYSYLCGHSRSSSVRVAVFLPTEQLEGDAACVKPFQMILGDAIEVKYFGMVEFGR